MRPSAVSVDEVRALRSQGQTCAEIGDRFSVSRQRIHQMCVAANIARPPKAVKPIRFPICNFKPTMRRWLFDAGYLQCTKCMETKCLEEWSPGCRNHGIYCRACSTKRHAVLYHKSDKIRKYCREYQRQHPEYYQKYRKSHPEDARARARKHYDKLRSTEEGREKLRAIARSGYHRRKERNA